MNIDAAGATMWSSDRFRIGLNRWSEGASTGIYVSSPSPSGADTVEIANGAHYNNHPKTRTIGHWIVAYKFYEYGNKVFLRRPQHDPVGRLLWRQGAIQRYDRHLRRQLPTDQRSHLVNFRIVLIAALALASVACGADGDAPTAEATPSATSVTASTRPYSPGSTPGRLSIENAVSAAEFDGLAAGSTVDRRREPNTDVVVLSVAPDGRVVARVGAPDSVDGAQVKLTQNNIELIEPGERAGEVIPGRPGSRPRQAVYGDADERTIVWTETSSTDLYRDDWVILAYDRSTKKTRLIAAAKDENTPIAPSGTVPFLAADRIYWTAAEATGREDRPARSHIFSRDLAAKGPIRREVTDATSLVADGDTAFYVKSSVVDPTIPQGQHVIHRLDLKTGQDSVVEKLKLTADEALSGPAASAGDLAWTINTRTDDGGPAAAVMTIREASGTLTTITGSGVSFLDPVLTPHFVGWNGDSDTGEQWLFDRHREVVVDLGLAPGFADVRGNANHVAWRDEAGDRRTGTLAP